MTTVKLVLVTLTVSVAAGASRLTSSMAKQNPTEEEFPVDGMDGGGTGNVPGPGAEWDTRCPTTVGSGAICMDCNKISVCLRGKVLPARDCPREAPYCVNSDGMGGHCSAKPDEEREDCRSDFQCSSEGYFPGKL